MIPFISALLPTSTNWSTQESELKGISNLYLKWNVLFCLGVEQNNNVEIVSGEWWRDSAMYIHSPPNSPPIQAAAKHCAQFHVLYSRALLVIHSKYSNVYMFVSNSLLPPHPSPSILHFKKHSNHFSLLLHGSPLPKIPYAKHVSHHKILIWQHILWGKKEILWSKGLL